MSTTAGTPDPYRARILTVEDDEDTASLLREMLTREGYWVEVASDGARAESMVAEVQPDLILLDIILPDIDGLVLCWRLRMRWQGPIILLSGTRRRWDRTLGLALGADEFISKPFDARELVAHVEAALRREATSRLRRGKQRFGNLVVDHARLTAELGGRSLPLTPTEFRLLAALAAHPNQALGRDELAQAVWDYGELGQSRALDTHVRRLRQKLQAAPEGAPSIATVRGFGYMLVP